MQLFVLVSTGQRIANLPPVLEHARPGDHVLWVASDEAERNNWTAAPRKLLERQGLFTVETVRVRHVNDPALLAAALEPFAESVQGQYDTTYLVANGGTKLSPVGLLFGLRALGPRILYGDDRPAVYSLYPPGLSGPPQIAPYTRHELDLPDILHVNGYQFAYNRLPLRIWPDPLPESYRSERYGCDEEYSYALHRDHYSWAQTSPVRERIPFRELGQYLSPSRMEAWQRTFNLARSCPNPQNLESLYNCTLNLAEEARHAAGRAQVRQPASDLGGPFERAVARRVREWLDSKRHPAVQSAWASVVVARDGSTERHDAEFDVLLVLKNGILIALECKTALASARDLEVNFHRLQQAASRLARVVIVLPLYTREENEPWFRQSYLTRSELVRRFGPGSVLAFTWPNQPTRYRPPGAEPQPEEECLEFETALETLLAPYLPRP